MFGCKYFACGISRVSTVYLYLEIHGSFTFKSPNSWIPFYIFWFTPEFVCNTLGNVAFHLLLAKTLCHGLEWLVLEVICSLKPKVRQKYLNLPFSNSKIILSFIWAKHFSCDISLFLLTLENLWPFHISSRGLGDKRSLNCLAAQERNHVIH